MTLNIRPSVAAFAQLMENRLRQFDREHGGNSWQQPPPLNVRDMLRRARANLDTLEADALAFEAQHPGALINTSAAVHGVDVANLVMMTLECLGVAVPDDFGR